MPEIASLNTILIELTEVIRGSGVTGVIVTPGGVRSMTQVSPAPTRISLFPASTIPDPSAVNVSV